MSGTRSHPLEVVLGLIARAAPAPWYPYREQGLNRQALDEVLEMLWLEGLIQKAPTSPEEGPAVELTAAGQRVLNEPELLDRLREGRAIEPNNPAAVIRANLRQPPPVRMCQLILLANIAVFLWGLSLAWKLGITKGFLIGFTLDWRGVRVLHQTGSLVGADLIRGEWWRLITSGFNHIGLIHLGMNMYALYAVGAFIEQRWGWWRFLIIYFISIWTGSCLAMTYQPSIQVSGASGGLFGVFAAVIAWLLLYGKYLPTAGRRRLWQTVTINVVLLVVMSLMLKDYISHWGHIGGALGGFVTCFVLHALRFGALPVKAGAVLALALIPLGSYTWLQHVWKERPPRVRGKEEKEDEEKKPKKDKKREKKEDEGWPAGPFYRHHATPIAETAEELASLCANMPLAPPEAVKRTVDKINRLQKTLAEQQAELKEARYEDKAIEKARKSALVLIEESIALGDLAKAHLDKRTEASKARLQAQLDKADVQANRFDAERKALKR